MLEKLTIDTFRPLVGCTFRVLVDERWELRARLTAVESLNEASASGRPREPFTLFFHAPPEARLPQRTYRVEAEGIEPMDLFLVPIGADPDGMRYQAVFT